MCRWLRVCHFYELCGCTVQQPDEKMVCESTKCKFSPYHPPTCQPPECRKTCIQQHGYPQMHVVTVRNMCPTHHPCR